MSKQQQPCRATAAVGIHWYVVALLAIVLVSPAQSEESSAQQVVADSAAVDALRQQVDEMRASLEQLRLEGQGLAEQLESAKERERSATAERDELQQELSATRETLQRVEQEKATAETQRDASEQQVATLGADLERMNENNSALEAEIGELKTTLSNRDQDIASLRELLPSSEGGTITVDQAKETAAKAQLSLIKARHISPASMTDEEQDAEAQLRRSQYVIAYSEGARSVYHVRPGDTLSLISVRAYGTGKRWPEIHMANQHLLEDPNRLSPGMTLVVP